MYNIIHKVNTTREVLCPRIMIFLIQKTSTDKGTLSMLNKLEKNKIYFTKL